MSGLAPDRDAYCDDFAQFQKAFRKMQTINVNSTAIRNQLKAAVQRYFRLARPQLLSLQITEQETEPLDVALQELLRLTAGNNAASTYSRWLKVAREANVALSGTLETKLGSRSITREQRSSAENLISETLRAMLPSAASSYTQALIDLDDPNRVSFRGPAAELREALREVLDHLAPDEAVSAQTGFRLEKDRSKPTMRQKVAFILKARGRGRSASGAPVDAAEMVEHGLGDLTRSVYTLGALATHVSAGRREVIQLKRYVEAVLMDILELE
jgi:hypothetical protein